MRLIDADKIVFDYSGLAHISRNDLIGIAKYFADQIEAMPTIAPPPNEPLTLEELWEMDGEPLFIKCLFNDELSSYVVFDKSIDSVGIFTRLFYASFDYYGNEWMAYRRKPEESE